MRLCSMGSLAVTLFLCALAGVGPVATANAQASNSEAGRAAILNQQGFKQLAKHHVNAAERSFQKALALNAEDPVAHQGLGKVAMRRHEYRAALTLFLQARELYAKRAASAASDRLEATAELDRRHQSASDQAASFADAGCLTERGVDLWMRDPQSGGEPGRPDGVDLRGTPPGLCFQIGTCQLHLGNLEAARTELERELLLAPRNAGAHLNLSVVLLRLSKPGEALEELDAAIRLGAKEPGGLREDILAAKRQTPR